MKKSVKILVAIVLAIMVVIAIVAIAGILKFNFTDSDIYMEKGEQSDSQNIQPTGTEEANNQITQMANPASTNCIKLGGKLEIQKRGDGGEYGLCYFEDNRACEEWALMRGDCPEGGVKTTGFDTIEQKYCAWLGGKTLAVPNSICTLKDGSKCSTIDFYEGKCPSTTSTENTEAIFSATFNCSDNKNIRAVFFDDKVELALSDGRMMLLPQAISASGARYVNTDESFVFWNKGNTAFVEEKDKMTFNDCLTSESN